MPAALFGLGLWLGSSHALVAVLGIASAAMAIVTIYCTGMIYASLRPIHQWHNAWVVPNYLLLALFGGALWLDALVHFWEDRVHIVGMIALLAGVAALAGKLGYWNFIDTTKSASTAESATGLGALGRVRLFEAPHTEENYLLREMGYRIARRHATKLRRIALLLTFGLPLPLAALALAIDAVPAAAAAVAACLSVSLGILAERWLFFAEAKHTVTLYYGAATA